MLLLGGLATCGDGDDRSAGDATTTTTTAATTSTTAAPSEVPSSWVGHDRDHRLVVVDRPSGEVVRVLAEFDDPDSFVEETGEPFAGGSFLGGFVLSPDGRTVYFERCCEPAPGMILRVAIDGGEPEQVAEGAFPALSPDGTRLAMVELQWIKVIDLRSGDVTRVGPADEPPAALGSLAWAPDGTTIAVERYDDDIERGQVVLLDIDDAASLDDARRVAAADARGTPTLPAFDHLGRLHVVYQQRSQLDLEPPATAVVIDSGSGEVISRRELDNAVMAQHHDPSGMHRIQTFADGTVRSWGPGAEMTVLGHGYLAAAW